MARTVEAFIRKAPELENPTAESYSWSPVTDRDEALVALALTMMDNTEGLAENPPVDVDSANGKWSVHFNDYWDQNQDGIIHNANGWPLRYEVHAPSIP